MEKDTMANIHRGQDYSDKRHAARIAARRAHIRLLTQLSANVPQELALEIMVASAVAFQAWSGNSSEETSLQVGRLARRVRNGDPIEL